MTKHTVGARTITELRGGRVVVLFYSRTNLVGHRPSSIRHTEGGAATFAFYFFNLSGLFFGNIEEPTKLDVAAHSKLKSASSQVTT